MRRSPRLLFLALAALVLSTVPAVPKGLPVAPRATPRADPWTSWEGAALLAEPIELSVTEPLRARCGGLPRLPEPVVLSAQGSDMDALDALARCLAAGPLRGYEIELFGSSELPARIDAAQEGSAPADVVRAMLGALGVPYSQMVTVDVDVAPIDSGHGAARVVLGLAPEEP